MTQTGRLAGDTSLYHDQKVSSLDATVSDFGKQVRDLSTPVDNSVHYFHNPVECAVFRSKMPAILGVSLTPFDAPFD